MCLTQPLLGLSACLKARENLWSGFRGTSRTKKVCQWWLQLVQVFQKNRFLEFKVLFLIYVSCLPSTNITEFIFCVKMHRLQVDGDNNLVKNHFCFNPGWICYAEKTHGDLILPYISTTRSPQQMMGSLVKGYFAEQQVQEQMNPWQFTHEIVYTCNNRD